MEESACCQASFSLCLQCDQPSILSLPLAAAATSTSTAEFNSATPLPLGMQLLPTCFHAG